MIDDTGTPPPARRSRRPLAAALTAVAAVALVTTFVLAGGIRGSAPDAGAPAAAPAGVPAVDQDPGVVDAGWVAPAGRGGTNAPSHGDFRGRGMRFGHITISKVDGSTLALVTDDGWTRSIDATGATIWRDGATIALGDLAVGDEIMLGQERQADGTFTVTAIKVILPKVAGLITDVTSSSITLALRDGTKMSVNLTSTTAYRLGKSGADKSALKVGMQATASGTKAADGTLTATSVTLKAARIAGTVTATSATTITVADGRGTTTSLKVTSTTTCWVAGVEGAKLADVKVAMWLVAEGVRNDDGSFTASAVQAAAGEKLRGWGELKRGWGGFKLDRGGKDKSPGATPAPAGTQPPTSNG